MIPALSATVGAISMVLLGYYTTWQVPVLLFFALWANNVGFAYALGERP